MIDRAWLLVVVASGMFWTGINQVQPLGNELDTVFARVDISAVGGLFPIVNVRGRGLRNIQVIGRDNATTGWEIRGTTTDEWKVLQITFVPTQNGLVSLNFKGVYASDFADNHHSVWLDEVSINTVTIGNGSFEQLMESGLPRAWDFHGGGPEALSVDGSLAKDGNVCVKVWHDQPATKVFEAEAWRTYRLRAAFRRAE